MTNDDNGAEEAAGTENKTALGQSSPFLQNEYSRLLAQGVITSLNSDLLPVEEVQKQKFHATGKVERLFPYEDDLNAAISTAGRQFSALHEHQLSQGRMIQNLNATASAAMLRN